MQHWLLGKMQVPIIYLILTTPSIPQDLWPQANTPESWGYYRRSDLQVQFAIAEGWTVGDMYQEGVIAVSYSYIQAISYLIMNDHSRQPTLIAFYGKLAVLRVYYNLKNSVNIFLNQLVFQCSRRECEHYTGPCIGQQR